MQEPNDESRIIAAISYILGILIAALVLLLKKDDRYTKFHSLQAIMLDIVVMVVMSVGVVLGFVAMFGIGFVGAVADSPVAAGIGFLGFWAVWLVIMLVSLGVLVLRLFLAWNAFTGKTFKLPVIGKHAERIAMG